MLCFDVGRESVKHQIGAKWLALQRTTNILTELIDALQKSLIYGSTSDAHDKFRKG